jgi:hypothetical protein
MFHTEFNRSRPRSWISSAIDGRTEVKCRSVPWPSPGEGLRQGRAGPAVMDLEREIAHWSEFDRGRLRGQGSP